MRNHRASFGVVLAAIILAAGDTAFGNPHGGTVSQGSATFNSSGSQLTITTSAQAYINWQSFNIAAGETTTFVQPSSSSLVWNQINDPNPSQILGNLNANGYVVLQNQNGFYIGGQAAITAHGLIMTTSPIPMPDLSAGGPFDFSAPPPTASIINYGQINTPGGSAFLIANNIENHGAITAPGGNIGLYAGQDVLVSTRPDGRGLSATVTLPAGSVDNSGKLIADGGSIALQAQVVNQGGLIQANSAANVNGVIELVAGDAVNLGASSVISAHGDSQAVSAGGSVTIKSGNTYSDQSGSSISIAGSSQGGAGGQLEISAANLSGVQSQIDGHAASGFRGGTFTIDPTDLNLTSAFVSTLTPILDSGLYQINLQADHNIVLSTLWNLSDPGASALLSLTAGNDIILNNGSGIAAGNNWNLSLTAGPQNLAAKPITSRTDGIYLDGSSFLQTQNGNIHLLAANEVLLNGNSATAVGNGIRTLAGGNIDVTAELGNINTGANPAGYIYHATAPYYTVSSTLGGISTAAGGNVTLTAGGDVKSYVPSGTSTVLAADAGSGAFGSNPGNVTITAGGNVYGHYVVADGAGTITAGGNVGALTGNIFALSLINGSWKINAPNGNIYLQEIRNPNGVFNNKKGFNSSAGRYLFDYSPQSSLTLNAGEGVYLTDLNVPRPFDPIPVIYPPSLFITAGLGGVNMADNVILFPSPDGDLHITTTGSFTGTLNGSGVPELIMSDSTQTRWIGAGTFGDADHGSLAELNNSDPVSLNISGNMEDVMLLTTKATEINVGGDLINSSFTGQNWHANDKTSITVGGQILYSSPYTFLVDSSGNPVPISIPAIPAADLPPGMVNSWNSVFLLLMDPTAIANLTIPPGTLPSAYAAVAGSAALFRSQSQFDTGNPGFVYNPATGRFGFNGPMSQAVLSDFTQPLTVLRYGKDGFPVTVTTTDPVTGLPVTHFVTDTISWAPPSQVSALFTASQSASTTIQYGLRVGGPGEFDVQAGSISLGNSYGILSEGVDDITLGRYQNLAPFTKSGATLNVTIDGNLEMLTSTIATLGGGDVNVTSLGGSMDLGSQELFGSPQRQIGFGLYSTGPGNVNVNALGDIDINGSRIATYDGGNITVESSQGNVNAGSGGATFIQVGVSFVDPTTGKAGIYLERVFGSGIVANTLVDPSQVPGAATQPGNITVKTPRGNISGTEGGIVQEALNGNVSAGPSVTLIAGTPASDGVPAFIGNIDLGDSGVIGGDVNVTATGEIKGLFISRQNSNIKAGTQFTGTVLSGGAANLSAASVSGTSTIIGVGGVSVAGTLDVGAAVLGQNVSVNGGAAQSTLGATASASSASQSAANTATTDAKEQVASADTTQDDEKKKKGKSPVLSRRVGRVTVLLPANS